MESIKSLCQRYRVRELAIFGSSLRDDFRAASDVDLLVEFEPAAQVGFLTLARLQQELAAILGRRVDLVPKGGLKPLIRQNILSDAEVLYSASELYLVDMVEAADAIGRFLRGVTREAFLQNELLQSAALHKLTIIGEAELLLSGIIAHQDAGLLIAPCASVNTGGNWLAAREPFLIDL